MENTIFSGSAVLEISLPSMPAFTAHMLFQSNIINCPVHFVYLYHISLTKKKMKEYTACVAMLGWPCQRYGCDNTAFHTPEPENK